MRTAIHCLRTLDVRAPLRLTAIAGFAALALAHGAQAEDRTQHDMPRAATASVPVITDLQVVPHTLQETASLPSMSVSRGNAGLDSLIDQGMGQFPTPVGQTDLTAADAGPLFAKTEYFCSNAEGESLPANEDSICPAGYMKVSVTTCEADEPCEL